MKKIIFNSRGFTLIELLVGIAIIITSATAVVILLSSSFRLSNKTTSLEAVRQSGNNAINQMQRTIQFADGFVGVSNDNVTYVTSCTTPSTNSYIKVLSGTTTKTFSCIDTGPNIGIKLDGVDLVDITKVDIVPGSCEFTCSQDSSAIAPVIGIRFSLFLKTSNSLPEKNATLDFSTSAKMRNL